MSETKPILAVGTQVRMLPDQLCKRCREAYQDTPPGLGTIVEIDRVVVCDDGERCQVYAVWVEGYSEAVRCPFFACDRELEPLD
ncbi:MAG TPA: hypothetical protein VNP04_15645 [Alphaproteobacteria bacterium]|nr:hypothetical protein [Alphaproteobacteria bacterium]